MTDQKAMRFNENKIRMDLIPTLILIELARVYTCGSYKYAPNNWVKGQPWMSLIGCSARHVAKWTLGNSRDPENGCHHLALAAWNLLTLVFYDMEGVKMSLDGKEELDNRLITKVKYDDTLVPENNCGERIGLNKKEMEEYLRSVFLEKKKRGIQE